MKVKVENTGSCRKVLHIEAAADDIAADYGAVLKVYRAKGRVSGFRQGKAPADVVEKKFAKSIEEDVKERVVPQLYRKALAEEKIVPVAVVEVSEVDFGKERGVSFDVIVDVAPDFKVPRYKKISLRGERVEVKDEEVEKSFGRLLDACARYEDVSGRPVGADDMVLIDYRGECDGKPVADLASDCSGLGEGKDFWTVAGEPEVLPGFGVALQGLQVGEEKAVEVRFPDDYHVKSAAGRTATYHVTLKGMREKVTPEVDAEFLKRFEVESEAELRTKVSEDLMATAEREEAARLKNEIAKYLLAKTRIELPQAVVEQETKLAAQGMVREIAMRGATREQIEAQKDGILKAATTSSQDRVKLSYILSRIAAAESIDVEDAEVDRRVAALAQNYRMTVKDLRERLEKRNGIENLRHEIRAEKTLDHLLEQAKVKK